MPRVKLNNQEPAPEPEIINYGVPCIPSGSTLLDLVMAGGWGEGRIVNIVGDKSAGKTLLAIEACANFAQKYPANHIRYIEAESAFDLPYARSMGLPEGVEMVSAVRTVEELSNDLKTFLEGANGNTPYLYILDSLDALSDEAEMDRDIGDGTYGTGKAKMMSQLFRRQVNMLETKHCTFIVISQIRDKIGVSFGETKTRSGGRALDFYASQVVWLSEIQKIKRTVTGVDRVVGVRVQARNKKNKIGRAYREAEFTIVFGYGVDDEGSMLDWIKKNKGEKHLAEGFSLADYAGALRSARERGERDIVRDIQSDLRKAVTARWNEIEDALAPTMRKYD